MDGPALPFGLAEVVAVVQVELFGRNLGRADVHSNRWFVQLAIASLASTRPESGNLDAYRLTRPTTRAPRSKEKMAKSPPALAHPHEVLGRRHLGDEFVFVAGVAVLEVCTGC